MGFLGFVGGGGSGGSGTPANPSTSVQFNNSGSFGGDQNLEWIAGTGLQIGSTAGTLTGLINLQGKTSGVVSLSVLDAAGTWTMKLPNSGGTNGYSLTTDGSGNCSWTNVAGSGGGITIGTTIITSGTNKRVLFDDNGVVGENAGLTFDKSSGNLGITTNFAQITSQNLTIPAFNNSSVGLIVMDAPSMGQTAVLQYLRSDSLKMLEIGRGDSSYGSAADQGRLTFYANNGADTVHLFGDNAMNIACPANATAVFRLLPSTTDIYFQNTVSGNIRFTANGGGQLSGNIFFNALSVVTSGGALATNATDGFLYIPTCAGTPTGTPTAHTGTVAMVYDTTNNKLYIYNSAWKGGTAPGTWS